MDRFSSRFVTLAFLLSFITCKAQTYYYQDFENGIPNDITIVDSDGNTPNINVNNFTNAWVAGNDYDDENDGVANSTSWYNPAGTADDWLILPAITLGKHAQLTWVAQAPDFVYPDGYEVYVGFSNDVDELLLTSPVFSIAAESAIDTKHAIELSDYPYETVYIAFRNNSFDKFVLTIDDIMVFETPDNDVAIVGGGFLSEVFSEIPASINLNLDLHAIVTNGGLLTSTFETEVVLTQNDIIIFTNSDPLTALGPNETMSVDLGGFVFSDTGNVTVEYNITPIGLDVNTDNNNMSSSSYITSEYLLKDNRVIDGSLGLGRNIHGLLGNSYYLTQDVNIGGVQLVVDPYSFGTMTGEYAKAVVYSMNQNGPDKIIAKTDSFLIEGPGPHLVDLAIEGGSVPVGSWFGVFVVEGDSNSTLAYSNNIFTKKTGWVYYNGFWANNEDYGFDLTYVIRPLLAEHTIGIHDLESSLNANNQNNITVYPNPTVEELIIDVSNVPADEFILNVFNLVGKLMYSKQYFSSDHIILNTTTWPNGVYSISIHSGANVFNKRVIKQ